MKLCNDFMEIVLRLCRALLRLALVELTGPEGRMATLAQ